jgi:hypothetical protein
MTRDTKPTERELAALADGSLAPERRVEVERLVAASPELQAVLAEQRRAVQAIQRRDDPAPPRLHARVEAMRGERRTPARRFGLAAGLAAAVAAVALALVLATGGGPTVPDAAAFASRDATAPPPPPYPGHPTLLHLETEEIPYPSWQRAFGWKAVGRRTDRLDGHEARTVFYVRGGERIAYTIVGGKALQKPDNADRTVRKGTELQTLKADGRLVVTWRREGHTCVLSGANRRELLRLAAWKGGGTVPY